MNTFVAKVKPSSLFFAIFGCLVAGPFVGILIYGGLNAFTQMKASELIPVFLSVSAVVSGVLVVLLLMGWVNRVELDERSLRIHKVMGKTLEYPLHNHHFTSHLTHQTRNGQHVGTTRTLKIHGPEGDTDHNLAIEPAEYSELINRLTGQVPAGFGHPAAAPAGAHRPLDFQPRRFDLNTKQPAGYITGFWVATALFVLAGAVLAWFLRDGIEGPIIVGVVFGLMALLMAVCALILGRRVSKVPRSVTVAPTWVAFDTGGQTRGFNFTDLRVIQIKPPGAIFERSAKILTKSGEQVIVPLGLDRYTKMFPEYDTFAAMLNDAGTAAAGVVRIDYS